MNADRQNDPDYLLIVRIKKGEDAAFAILVDKYKQPLMNMLVRIVQDPIEAEDLAQSAFIHAYKAIDKFNFSSKFGTWLFTIARNLALNELRRRSRHPADSLEQTVVETDDKTFAFQYEDKKSPVPRESILKDELVRKVEEALMRLPENQRTAILLFQQDDMSYEEIAKVLGCSVSATKSIIHRGRETLKQILKPYLKSGEWQQKSNLKG
ncbi:MAG: RNA polymerase sigma factor [Verrucomicrobiia bacterium]